MITNAAFLAALTVFLLAAWLAGELTLPGALQGALFRAARAGDRRRRAARVLQPVRRLLRRGAVAVPARHRPQAAAPGPATRHARRRARRPGGAARSVAARCLWTATSTLETNDVSGRTLHRSGRGGLGRSRRSPRRSPRGAVTRTWTCREGASRERVRVHGRATSLRGSEVRALATVGAFRVVPTEDLREVTGRTTDARTRDLYRLREAGLVRTIPYGVGRDRTTLVVLTERGRELLESHRLPGRGAEPGVLRRPREAARGAARQPRLPRLPAGGRPTRRARASRHPPRRPRLRAEARLPAVPAAAQTGNARDVDAEDWMHLRERRGMGARTRPAVRPTATCSSPTCGLSTSARTVAATSRTSRW